jgi:hypothetical protein
MAAPAVDWARPRRYRWGRGGASMADSWRLAKLSIARPFGADGPPSHCTAAAG